MKMPRFYTDEEIALTLSDLLQLEPIDQSTNQGRFYNPRSKKEMLVGWIFSPEDYGLVRDVDLLIVFTEATGDIIPISGYTFLPSAREVVDNSGWLQRIYRLYSLGKKHEQGKEFMCVHPKAIEDYIQGC